MWVEREERVRGERGQGGRRESVEEGEGGRRKKEREGGRERERERERGEERGGEGVLVGWGKSSTPDQTTYIILRYSLCVLTIFKDCICSGVLLVQGCGQYNDYYEYCNNSNNIKRKKVASHGYIFIASCLRSSVSKYGQTTCPCCEYTQLSMCVCG